MVGCTAAFCDHPTFVAYLTCERIGRGLTRSPAPVIRILIMPTYQYVCEKCGHQFEKVQPISAAPLGICPKELCTQKRWGKGKVKRAISTGGGLIFKGSGFYVTDYRSDKYKEAAKKESAPASASAPAAKSDSGGEAKPAPAAPASKPGKASAAKS